MPAKTFNGPVLFPRQLDLYDALKKHRHTLAFGSSRGGKSFTIMDFIVARATIYPKSAHLVLRLTGNSIKPTIWSQTLLPVLDAYGLRESVELNLTDLTATFDNGSVIYFTGVQDDERIQKVLGAEYQTIFLNEATNIEYDVFEVIASRLNGNIINPTTGKRLELKIVADCNPTSKAFWLYQLFCEKIVPGTNRSVADPDAYTSLHFDAEANPTADYSGAKDRSAAYQRRFLAGLWSDEVQGALFSADDLDDNRADPPEMEDFDMIAVGVDPAVTNTPTSDETGIFVAGMIMEEGEAHYYPLEDLSGRYHPHEWAQIVADAYARWSADVVVIETTQGGDQNAHTLRTADPRLNIMTVNPGRGQGKNIRCMPIASEMKAKRIHHPHTLDVEGEPIFAALEAQMLGMTGDYDRKKKKSPDRLDAYVYAISELLTGDGPAKPVVVSKIANYFS